MTSPTHGTLLAVDDVAALVDHIASMLSPPTESGLAEDMLRPVAQTAVETALEKGILRDGRAVVDRENLARWFHRPNTSDRSPDARAYQNADELIDAGILHPADQILQEAAEQLIHSTPQRIREFYEARGRAKVRAAVVALAEGWIGFDDSHAFGETLIDLIDDPDAALEPVESRQRARMLRHVDDYRDTHAGPMPYHALYAIVSGETLTDAVGNQPRDPAAGKPTPHERLDAIAQLIRPCPPPDVYAGYDLCVCGYGGTYPCPNTKAAWHAQGLDLQSATREALGATRPDFYPPEVGEMHS